MNREASLKEIKRVEKWDMIIIGGGATGLGVAVDSASRGFKTLLLEQADFAKGTSSRSTKLVHGGVRYLAQGNLRLVREGLLERGYLLKNAPHLTRRLAFIIPVYSFFKRMKYSAGLKLYDWLAGMHQIGSSRFLSKTKVIERIPAVKTKGLKGGVLYYDGQFDDARLAISLALTCEDCGGTVINYMKVAGLLKQNDGKVSGVETVDVESGKTYTIRSKAVVNATGVFVDEIHRMDNGQHEHTVQPSQGIHLVLGRQFLQTITSALMIPATDDGRVLFLVPWHDHLLAGTTDTPMEEHTLEPRALEKEVDFILRNAAKYLIKAPEKGDVLSVFAGLRPLAIQHNGNKATKDISRNHSLQVSPSGLVTITGGKWTTYRKMGEDTVNKVIEVAGLIYRPCITKNLKIHGWSENNDGKTDWNVYGSDSKEIQKLITENPESGTKIDGAWPYTYAEVAWAIRNEMARNVEDILSRRFRVLFLDADAAIRMAPCVAKIMKEELQKDDAWVQSQIKEFVGLASQYMILS